jgi:hypothetical protein
VDTICARVSADAAAPAPHRGLAVALIAAAAALLGVVLLTPVALSSQDLLGWAAAPTGLSLPRPWPVLVFLALDAAAGTCVLLTVYAAWRGEPAGVFGLLVWCFAAGSAFANWRHGTAAGAAPDAGWFFPAMSLAGPALLEAVLRRLRRWAQRGSGRRGKQLPSFGWRRWTPGLGALRDTYGAYRTALLADIDTVEAAVAAFHNLCPDGSLRVAAALRARHLAAPAGRRRRSTTPPASAALLRRIPTEAGAYERWRAIWAELAEAGADGTTTARLQGISPRQLDLIRSAGRAGLLTSPIPPQPAPRHPANRPSPAAAWPGPPPR